MVQFNQLARQHSDSLAILGDQYSGVFFGLGAAYDLVDNEAFRSSIRTLVTQLLEFLLKHLWTVVMPGGALSECPGRPISTTFIGRPEQQLNFRQACQSGTFRKRV